MIQLIQVMRLTYFTKGKTKEADTEEINESSDNSGDKKDDRTKKMCFLEFGYLVQCQKNACILLWDL